jgi:transposase
MKTPEQLNDLYCFFGHEDARFLFINLVLLPPKKGVQNMTTYTVEYRRETADYIISTGRPVRQVAEELGINYKTANNWVIARKKQLSGTAPATESNAELLAAQKRIRELEMENAFLKKAAAFFAKDQA